MSEVKKYSNQTQWGMNQKHHPGMAARFKVLFHLFANEQGSAGHAANKKMFAETLGVSDSKLSNWFAGQRPAVDMGMWIVDHFALDLDWLYRGETGGISMVRSREIQEIARTLDLEKDIQLL